MYLDFDLDHQDSWETLTSFMKAGACSCHQLHNRGPCSIPIAYPLFLQPATSQWEAEGSHVPARK